MTLDDALKLSGVIAIDHPSHPLIRPCAACAVLVLADALQDLRIENKRLRKRGNACVCGNQLVDGLCGKCSG